MREADFSPAVRHQLAQEAMYVCSSPTCYRFTGYGTSEGKARTIAEAAHVNAAGKQGPRAAAATAGYLKSAENGIWLCSICHAMVDNDPTYYSEDTLRKWKSEHRALIARIVGKDLESALLDLRNRKRYHEEARDILSFLENRRVMYEGLDHEFPPRVLESLDIIRQRLVQTRARINPDTGLYPALSSIQALIDGFFRNIGSDLDLRTLRCDGRDPRWLRFSEELIALRKGIVLVMKHVADASGYELSWV